ncbi:MAG: DUF2203 domain-containing protein [Calditrichaceae bacterium]
MYHYDKHFTVDEALLHLPKLRNLLTNLRESAIHLKEIGFDFYEGRYRPGFHPDTFKEYPDEYEEMISLIRDVTNMGIEIKGLELGLIDFPALRDNGEEVFLCWKLDEDDIEFWHAVDKGFKGRKHIDDF